jgi:hypothetical protein
MGEIKVAEKVVMIAGFLFTDEELLSTAAAMIAEQCGPIALESQPIDFIFTDYYTAEMGAGIKRSYAAFERLIDPDELPEIKLLTNDIEIELSQEGQRRVNIDPGYLNLSKLVLASTKDFAHRLYLRRGIFAEITLNWQNKHFIDMPWTYPDYRSDYAKQFFTKVRDYYRTKLTNKM